MTKRYHLGIGLACLLLLWVASPAVSYAASSSASAAAIISDDFSSGTLAPFIANNDMSPGGQWSVANGALVATDYGLSSDLPNQIASIPDAGKNVVLTTSFTINQLNPDQPYRIGVFGRGSTPKTGSSQWDFALNDGNLSLINQSIGVPAKVSFPVQAGQSYNMVAVIDGSWIGAQVWAEGTPQPSQWTMTGTVAKTGNFSSVGVVAGNANVTFQNFAVYHAPPRLSVTPTQSGAVYQSGQPVTYQATLAANSATEGGQYYVNYALTSLSGSTVGQGAVPLTLPDGGTASTTIFLPAQNNGYYNATFSLSGNAAGVPFSHTAPSSKRATASSSGAEQNTSTTLVENSTTSLAVVPNEPNQSTLDPSSFFGINGPGNGSGPITPSLERQWTKAYRLFKTQGIQWARTQFLWNNVEPSPGIYTWDTSDGLVTAAQAANENLLGLVDYAGTFANPFAKNGKPQVSFTTFVQDYDQYVQALVQRYMPGGTLAHEMGWGSYGISAWEIWNEPSRKQYWLSQNPAQYAELVQSASAAIKAVDPSATVLAYDWQQQTLVQTAGTNSFTGVSIHEYPATSNESAFYQTIADLRQFLVQNGIGNDPIWMTETGWAIGNVTPTIQAEYLQRAAIQSLAASLNKFFMFDWSYPSKGYGELSGSLLPLPSYPALAAAAYELDGYAPAAGMNPVNMGSAIRAFAFQNGSQSLVAVWSPRAQGTLTLNDSGMVSADDWMGNPIAPTGSELTVPLNGQPVFLKADLPPQQLLAMIQNGTISGMPAVSLSIAPLSQLPGSLPPIQVTITNQVNVTQSGTLTLNLPSGWEAVPSMPIGASPIASATPSVDYGPLAPGASVQESFNLVRYQASPDNQYSLTASATASSSQVASSQSQSNTAATTTLQINPKEAVYGSPGLTGSFSDWSTATPMYVNQKSQNVGIPNWSSNLASATAYTMWDSKYLYLAAQVKDSGAFFQPYSGSSIWKGDSVQVYLDPQNTKTIHYNGADGDTQIGFAQTPSGNQAYERRPTPTLLNNVKLTIVPGASNGDMWYEAAIPISDLLHWTAQAGQTFGLDFLVNYNFGHGRVGWMQLSPGVGNGFDPAAFPTFTLVNSSGLAALALNQTLTTGNLTFTPDAEGALLTVTNSGLNTINVALSDGTTLTLNASSTVSATVTPSGPNPTVPISLNGTTTINLTNYVTTGSLTTLTVGTNPQIGASATIAVDNGINTN